jgi:hypothetical protein
MIFIARAQNVNPTGTTATATAKASAVIQSKAVKAWADSLTQADYNATNWAVTMRYQPSNFFEHYTLQLSKTFLEQRAMVNFVMVGACDGTHDKTIRDRFLPNSHWRGVFVEPFEMNFRDLSHFMEENNVLSRAYLLRAAATFRCNTTMVKMKRPTFEEKNQSLPHWMRREIGAIVPYDKLDRPATGGWTFEYAPCVNGQQILQNWTNYLQIPSTTPNGKARLRPHILKVDAEGHDYQVLMSFLHDRIPSQGLPLLINFEAKSIVKRYDDLIAHLKKR